MPLALMFQKAHSKARIPVFLLPKDLDVELLALLQHCVYWQVAILPGMMTMD